MNFKEWLLAEERIRFQSKYPIWNVFKNKIGIIPQEIKSKLTNSIYDAATLHWHMPNFNGGQIVSTIRHQFTTYEQELNNLRKQPMSSCLTQTNFCRYTQMAYEMVQEVIEKLIKPEHIAMCRMANRAWLAKHLNDFNCGNLPVCKV